MIKAVIFDRDGVLMLTEPIFFKAYAQTIKHFGGKGDYSWESHKSYMGMVSSEKFEDVKTKFNLKISLDEFLSEYRGKYLDEIEKKGLIVPPGVWEFINLLKKEGIKKAIATGALRRNAELTLLKTGLLEEFEIVITADDVAKGKPDPETFLLAAKKLRVSPHECVVIGDAINDVLGAKSAGMKMIAITDKSYIEDPDLASPDLEVKEFKDITIEMIKSL